MLLPRSFKARLWETRYRLTHSSFRTAWLAETAMLYADPRRLRDPILVYQMGRVGSSSAVEALRARFPFIGLYQPHWLSAEGLDWFERLNRESFSTLRYPLSLLVRSRFLQRRVRAPLHGRPWRVVTAVRDPVARNLSWFFTEMQWRLRPTQPLGRFHAGDREGAVQELIRLFREEYEHDTPVRWFERELETVFGIDVCRLPFDPERGWSIYEAERARVLLYRQENLREGGETAFAAFLGVPEFRLTHSNRAEEKPWAAAHDAFRAALVLDDDYLDRLYDTQMMRHFYRPEEIDRFRARWRKPRVLVSRPGPSVPAPPAPIEA